MDSTKPVVWKEGTFVAPQHFQQQQRAQTRLLQQYVQTYQAQPGLWGFTRLEINSELLKIGKLAVTSAQGFFPDGHYFQLDQELVIDIPENLVKQAVYLSLPLALEGNQHFGEAGQQRTRYRCKKIQTFDTASSQKEAVEIEVAIDNLQLVLPEEENHPEANAAGTTRLAVALILEKNESGEVILDQAFIPPVMNVQASAFLIDKNKMLHSLLWHRAEEVINRIKAGQADKSEQSQMKEHMWLQTLNRWIPWADLLVQSEHYSAYQLYQSLCQLVAELSSLIPELPVQTPTYHEDRLHSLFNPLYLKLRQLLGTVVMDSVITYEWDRQLFEKRRLLRTIIKQPDQMVGRRFVLAATSSLGSTQLASLLPASATIAGSSRIVERVRNAMSGIDIKPLAVAPEQLKTLKGYQYFDINIQHELWQEMLTRGETLNMHIDNRIPDLNVVMYAI